MCPFHKIFEKMCQLLRGKRSSCGYDKNRCGLYARISWFTNSAQVQASFCGKRRAKLSGCGDPGAGCTGKRQAGFWQVEVTLQVEMVPEQSCGWRRLRKIPLGSGQRSHGVLCLPPFIQKLQEGRTLVYSVRQALGRGPEHSSTPIFVQ